MADLTEKPGLVAATAGIEADTTLSDSELASARAEDDKEGEESEKNKTKKPGSLHFFIRVHWTYSTGLDHTLRLVGLAAAIASGVIPPLMTVVFGSSVNGFNSYESGAISGPELYSSTSQNALWLLYLFIARFALVYVHSTCFGLVGIRVTRAFRFDFIRSMIKQDVAFIDSCAPGTVASTISNSADMVENGSTEKVGSLIQNMSMFVAAFIVAFTRQWKLTLVTATTLPVLFIGFKITFGLDAKIEAKILEIYNRAGGLVEEALATVRIVTAFDAGGKLSRKYDEYLAQAQKLGFRKGPVIGVQWSVEFFSIYCAYALAWFYGAKLLNNGEIDSGGQIISVLLAVLLGTNAASNVAPGFGDFAKASAAAQGMFDMIDRKSEIDPLADTGERLSRCDGTVELRSVSFSYPSRPSVQVLQDISLTFEAGKVTALVGASGSGKSTIVALIERWFNPNSGSVLLDGHSVADLNLRWLRGRVGLVQQEPQLFSDTIYNNVVHGLYGTPMDSRSELEKRELVRQACIQAFADEFIQELPQKYDTKVGDRGALLSGGQKQRIAIARSIIANPQILLLDEATSALDPTAERNVQASLDNVSKQRTIIMIAHKLSTVQKADKIVVLSKGEIVEQGTHQELLDLQGAYHELVNAQTLHAGEPATGPQTSKIPNSDDYDDDEDDASELVSLLSTVTMETDPQGNDDPQDEEEEEKNEDKAIARKLSIIKCLRIIIFKDQWYIWPIFLFGALSSAAGGGLFPAQAVLFGSSLPTLQLSPGDQLVSQGNFWALMYFVFSLGVFVCYLGVGFFWTLAAFHATRFYRRQYFDSMLRQDVAYFDTRGHGAAEMTSRLSLHPQRLQNLLSVNLALIIVIFVDIGSCLILAIAMGWRLGLVVAAAGMPLLFGAGFFRLRLEMANEDRLTEMYLECARFASEAVGAIRTVSSLTLEQKVLDGFQKRLTECSSRELRSKMLTMLVHSFAESINLAITGLAFWYGGKLLSEGYYDIRTFFIVFMAVLMGSQSGGVLFGFSSNVTKAHSAANYILDLHSSRPPINTSTGLKEIPPASSEKGKTLAIEFRDVTFAYPNRPNHPVLHGLNLKIEKGTSVGIVGASGSGKSTIIALIERFYDINSGHLLVDGTPLRELDVHNHRGRIGLVSQDTMLFQGSVHSNILLGVSDDGDTNDAAESRVERACREANVHDFIISLPDGYATDVGNRGVALSGGQRQRLAIARALIRNPDLLLFDEATSALDTANEAAVQAQIEAVAREKPGRTTIAVAHRLSTIRRCDRIFVLHHGKVSEEGTHEELVAKKGRYFEMVLAQALDREVDAA